MASDSGSRQFRFLLFEGAALGLLDEQRDAGFFADTRLVSRLDCDSRRHYIGARAAIHAFLAPSKARCRACVRLVGAGRVDLAIETLVIDARWSDLFSPEDRERASERLSAGAPAMRRRAA